MDIDSDKINLFTMITAGLSLLHDFCCHKARVTFLSQIWRLMLEQDLPPRMSAFTTPSYQPEKELRLES